MKGLLFSLSNCIKCEAVKRELDKNIVIIEYSNDIKHWKDDEIKFAKKHDVFDDLKRTAPILVYENGEKIIGQLRILKRVRDEKKI